MQIDIPAHIEKLLFLHDALVIPSFGGFNATRVSATADYVGGSVVPAAKTLTFSENLTIDDGMLVEDVANTHHISLDEARKSVNDFVEKMQALLNQREIVTLPGVGRLYKNYVQKIQFLPDATNFSAESYGLPPLQFSPIARSREVQEKTPDPTSNAATPPPATTTPASPPSYTPPPTQEPYYTSESDSGNSTIFAVIGVLVFLGLVVAGIWWWRNRQAPDATAEQTEQVVEDLTVPTDRTATKVKENTPDPTPAEKTPDESVRESVDKKMRDARKEVQDNASGRLCILVIATLKDKTNADRLKRSLQDAGYELYAYEAKNGYQIGVQFRYQNLAEVQQKLEALQKLTKEDNIWIKKK